MTDKFDIQSAIKALCEPRNLESSEMSDVMSIIMSGEATPAQIGAFLIGLSVKGETVEEIAAAAGVMRSFATSVDIDADAVVDPVGTGGDGGKLFNVSTASAFVAAGAGARIAKHGNRAMSGRTGAADLLETAGVNIMLEADQVARCINEVGIGFMFAPSHHGATRHAVGPRREIGVRSIFNLLGPLTNPAGALRQMIGVFDKRWVRPLAEVLASLGSKHVMVVHSADGLDEISIADETFVSELHNGSITDYKLSPTTLDIHGSLDDLTVDSAEQSLEIIETVMSGEPGPAANMVIVNAGATIYCADVADSLEKGMHMARESISSGAAQLKLRQLASFSQQFSSDD